MNVPAFHACMHSMVVHARAFFSWRRTLSCVLLSTFVAPFHCAFDLAFLQKTARNTVGVLDAPTSPIW